MKIKLDDIKDVININQSIVFYNTSNSNFSKLYLYNWANSYSSNKAPLSKRMIDDFDKSLYFAKEKDRGWVKIKNLSVNFKTTNFREVKDKIDILEIDLENNLAPNDSLILTTTYQVKIPNSKFTGYGKTRTGYQLRYWYLTPALFTNKWELTSNLNMDDMLSNPTDFEIYIELPKYYFLKSNLYEFKNNLETTTEYYLTDKNKTEVILSIDLIDKFKSFQTDSIKVITDLYDKKIDKIISKDILNRQLSFIRQFLGNYPHSEIFLDKATQSKNPIYGLNQLPKFINPFPDIFEWDLTVFKALSKRYIDNTLLLDRRNDYWLTDGLQTYLMMLYVEKYYPEIKLFGDVSKIWPLKNFNFSKLDFNDKYPFIYQFSSRQFLDQPLTTKSNKLSNFNRKIVSKYKAGLGLRYLSDFVGDTIIKSSFKDFYLKNNLKFSNSSSFNEILLNKTDKNLSWFFGDYLNTSKKIDYKITKSKEIGDSLEVTIKNKRNFTAPVAFYGIKDKEIKFKRWLTDITSDSVIIIPKKGFNRLSLNYENTYPENNSLDNWKKIGKKILNKPIQIRLYKDMNAPYYHQIFLEPNFRYNFYDGVLLGLTIHNKPILARNFQFKITPMYGIKSSSLNGTFSAAYNLYFENSKINKIIFSTFGGNLHYAENLSYNTFNQSVTLQFRRKNLRSADNSFISARLLNINKEVADNVTTSDEDKYNVLQLRYFSNKPNIIKGFKYSVGAEFGSDYSKLIGDIRYRKLTATNRQLDFRLYTGTFLRNNTTSDYFSFGLDRANDYLFELNYYGRSESSGLFSQQFIMAQGSFKSVLPVRYANEYMISFNSSIGLWRWLEAYNDIALVKNRNNTLYTAYESGIRINFIHNILELYFPIYSNNGWEISQDEYDEKIRFVLQLNFKAIFNFFRRGFL